MIRRRFDKIEIIAKCIKNEQEFGELLNFFHFPSLLQAIFSEKRCAQTGRKEAVGQFRGSPAVFHVLDHYCASIDPDNIAGLLRIRSCRDGSQLSIGIGKRIEIINGPYPFAIVSRFLKTFARGISSSSLESQSHWERIQMFCATELSFYIHQIGANYVEPAQSLVRRNKKRMIALSYSYS